MDAFTLTSSGLFRQSPGLQHPLLREVVHAGVQHHPTLKVTNIHENPFFWPNHTNKIHLHFHTSSNLLFFFFTKCNI